MGWVNKINLDDSQLLKFETYGRPFNSTEMKPNEPCELLSGKQSVYKPVDLELFRKNIVSIQMNFWSIYGIWPDLNQLMLGLIWPCLMTLSYAPRYRNVRLCGGDKCGSLSPVYNLWYRTTWSQSICMRLRDYGWCSGRFNPHGKYGKLTVRIFS